MDPMSDIDAFNLDQFVLDSGTDLGSSSEDLVPEGCEYMSIQTQPLGKFLSLASQFGWRSSKDLVPKSVLLDPDGEDIVCRATDFDSYLTQTISNLSKLPMKDSIAFPTSLLLRLVKLCPSHLILARIESRVKALVMGQWVEIEPLVLDPSSFVLVGNVVKKGDAILPMMDKLSSIAASGKLPMDRKLTVMKDAVLAKSYFSSVRVSAKSPMEFVINNARTATMLSKLGDKLHLSVVEGDITRLQFSSDSQSLSILMEDPLENVEDNSSVPRFMSINISVLHQLLALSTILPTSSGMLLFESDTVHPLMITYCSRLSNTTFPIKVDMLHTPSKLTPSTIQTSVLVSMIKPLSGDKVDVGWDDTRLYLSQDDIIVALAFDTKN